MKIAAFVGEDGNEYDIIQATFIETNFYNLKEDTLKRVVKIYRK
jgi:hypothetical protein